MAVNAEKAKCLKSMKHHLSSLVTCKNFMDVGGTLRPLGENLEQHPGTYYIVTPWGPMVPKNFVV